MRALLSVYDKTGLVDFAHGLEAAGVELIASGGTAAALEAAGIVHQEVADITGAPEMLGGRVKTLHPVIAGGILADRSLPEHLADLAARDITPIDLVVCNLYPFAAEPSIEMIDVGGPTMVRAAAKNHAHVTVIVDPSDYAAVLSELGDGAVSAHTRRALARKAFAHVAAYDATIVSWFDEADPDVLPDTVHLALERAGELRYGENPHQHGARYRTIGGPLGFWDGVLQHGGRELSYLNLFDGEAAWRLAHELLDLGSAHAAVIVKHANPCGVALDDDLTTAYERAFSSDPISAFGGVVALPGHIDLGLAEAICANPLADVLICASAAPEAIELFGRKRKNMRLLLAPAPAPLGLGMRQIDGGFLVQDADRFLAQRAEWRIVTEVQPEESTWRDIELAWRVCARTSSNAIVLANGGQIVGVGCGQQNRVDAAGLAARKAEGRAKGGVGASDAFFPFRDGLDAVCDAGASVIIAPGGSLRDEDIIAAANEREVAMIFTGERHFKH
jgi:phosphoribosylaminoimidazolecarboxamide formyltransferase / IMP cyclohydrolase